MGAGHDRSVDLDGPVHYREWPASGRLTFVCLHSVGGSHLHWNAVAPGLARHGRVVAVDLPGFGLTPRLGRGGRLEQNQRLLSGFLATIAPGGDAVLVGHSMGGGLAILQAAAEPDSVAGLVLSGSAFPAARGDLSDRAAFAWYLAHRARMRGRALLRSGGRVRSVGDVVGASLRGGAADPRSIDAQIIRDSVMLARTAQPARDTAQAFVEAARSTFSLLSHPAHFRTLLNRIACPVLLLHGGRDRTVPVAFAERVAHDHPAWRLVVFADLGHLIQLEASERWLAAVEQWLPSLVGDSQ
ncbi:MAG: alpha/beta fold hydrolase [Candidatus Dormibacteria bacterium]